MFIARFTWSGPWCGLQVSLPSLRRWHVCTCDFLMHMKLRWPLDVGVGCPDCCNPGLVHVPCWSILVCNMFCFHLIATYSFHLQNQDDDADFFKCFLGWMAGRWDMPALDGCKKYQTKMGMFRLVFEYQMVLSVTFHLIPLKKISWNACHDNPMQSQKNRIEPLASPRKPTLWQRFPRRGTSISPRTITLGSPKSQPAVDEVKRGPKTVARQKVGWEKCI